jgi:hypothetical protein
MLRISRLCAWETCRSANLALCVSAELAHAHIQDECRQNLGLSFYFLIPQHCTSRINRYLSKSQDGMLCRFHECFGPLGDVLCCA